MSRSYAFLVLLFLAVVAVSFSNAENVEQNKEQEKVEPMSFFHKKDPFHMHPIKKYPLPPLTIPIIKKKPCPPIIIPKFTIPKPVYVHKPIPIYKPVPHPVYVPKPVPHPVYVHKPVPIYKPVPHPVYVPKPVPHPVYVHKHFPIFTIPKKKPCPPIFKKPYFPGHP